MPEMNGFDFVKQVSSSAEERLDAKLPILILTGHADEETVRGAATLGINGYLVKPVSRKSLESRILKTISSPATRNI
jgi:response regulator RpfG family c-di-GMP phosphodiesterase